jgi:tetratricopeptide (TPR) repeat protein
MPLYDAFISYSHAKDKPIAAALQSVVQTLGKPWYRRRALRLFRDDTSLGATPHLWPTIVKALDQSRFFVLLASPEAAQSTWVDREVAYWLTRHGPETVLIGVTAGTLEWDHAAGHFAPHDGMPLPPALKGRFSTEPKWVDLRKFRDAAQPRDEKLIELGADFAAIIRDMPKEDLLSQEVREQRRALNLAWSAVGSLLILAGVATWQWSEATVQRKVAVAQRERAEATLAAATQTANGLISDLALRFRNSVGVPATLVKDMLDRALALQRQLTETAHVTPELRKGEAAALAISSDTLLAIGDPDAALAAAQRSRDIFQDLLLENPANTQWQLGLSIAYNRIGNVLRAQQKYAEALAAFDKDFVIIKKLADSAPGRLEFQHELALNYQSVGDVLVAQGKYNDAIEPFLKMLDIDLKLAKGEPDNIEWLYDLANGSERVAMMFAGFGKTTDALAAYRRVLAINQKLVDKEPGSARAQRALAITYDRIGAVLMLERRYGEALDSYLKGLAITKALAASDSGNAQGQLEVSISSTKVGEILARQGKFDDAIAHYDQAIASNLKNASAFNGRCLARAVLDLLEAALADCNASLGLEPNKAATLNSRGFTYLKLGQPEKAITDYDAALRLNPKLAQSLYGRGLAKTRTGEIDGGKADIAAATAMRAGIADELTKYGLR